MCCGTWKNVVINRIVSADGFLVFIVADNMTFTEIKQEIVDDPHNYLSAKMFQTFKGPLVPINPNYLEFWHCANIYVNISREILMYTRLTYRYKIWDVQDV